MIATIGIVIDVIIVAVLVIFGLIGLKKGFLKSILSIFSFGLCLIIAIYLAKYVAKWVNGIYDFSSLIGNKIEKSLHNMNEFFAQSINVYEAGGKDALINAIPNEVNTLLTQLIKVVFSNGNINMASTDTIGSVVGSSLGQICVVVISGILVFIVLRIVIALLTRLFDNITKTKIIGGLNKILGLLLGLAKAVLIIGVVNVVLVTISMVPMANKLITPVIQDNTHVEKFIYNSTDKLFGEYVIEGDALKNLMGDLWKKR